MKRKTPPPSSRATDQMDKVIGAQIRRIRLAKGMSQSALGEDVGVTFQQIQKVEKGVNRIAASRLYRVALALETPVAKFFGE